MTVLLQTNLPYFVALCLLAVCLFNAYVSWVV